MAKKGKGKKGSGEAKAARKLAKAERRELRAEADALRPVDNSQKSAPSAQTLQSRSVVRGIGNYIHGKRARDRRRRYPVNSVLASHASNLLALAVGVGILMIAAFFGLPEGNQAIPAIGGMLTAKVPIATAQIAFALDTLFPIFYGAGLALLITGVQSRDNRPLVRIILSALLIAVLADFAENALVFQTMTGGKFQPLQWPVTVVKFAGLALVAVLASAILPRSDGLGQFVHVFTRYVFPVGIAVLLSGLGGELGRSTIGVSFPLALLVLSIYANRLSDPDQAQ